MKNTIKILCCLIICSSTVNANSAYISVNGLKIHYQEYGEGELLILLHGGSLTSASWKRFIPEASKHSYIYALDSLGHGKTNNSDGEISYQQMTDDVANFIRKLKLNKPVFMGYSDGGLTTFLLAIQYTEIPTSIIIGGATDTLGNNERYFDGIQ
jgi:pimeloyl-ACP methyl ester carboxylesterase